MVRLSFLFKVFRSKDYALLPFCLFQLKYGQYPFMVGWPHSERLYHVVFCLLCHSLVFQYCTSWAYDEHIFQFHALCGAIVDEVYAVSSVGVGHPVEVFNRGIRIVCSICKTRMCHCVWVLSAIAIFKTCFFKQYRTVPFHNRSSMIPKIFSFSPQSKCDGSLKSPPRRMMFPCSFMASSVT